MSQKDRQLRKLTKRVIREVKKGKTVEEVIEGMNLDPYTEGLLAFEVGMKMEARENR